MTAGTAVPVTGEQDIRVEIADGVALVMLARPAQLNALRVTLLRQLRRALLDVSDRDDVRAVVLAGEGRAFCAGLDVRAGLYDPASEDPALDCEAWLRDGVEVVRAMRSIPQPIIAAVHGWAIGAGFAFAAASDVRFIGPEARFSAPFLKLGMTVGDLGLSWFLPRIVGAGRANRIFYDAGVIDARTAVEYGLATEVSADPLAGALAYGRRLASYPWYGVRVSKELINAGGSTGLNEHLEAEARAQVIGGLAEASKRAFRTAAGTAAERDEEE
ncbi:enoyl-CoA hydratase/isomerase family protein [Tsukamurella soli]|uniref:Enoyl-CoA hydratase family protein n=1 Tax=Tsukamurella soli TaxID=644556 RepID=A0ABP8J173_9ACTN